jgi:hypothetical protein
VFAVAILKSKLNTNCFQSNESDLNLLKKQTIQAVGLKIGVLMGGNHSV